MKIAEPDPERPGHQRRPRRDAREVLTVTLPILAHVILTRDVRIIVARDAIRDAFIVLLPGEAEEGIVHDRFIHDERCVSFPFDRGG